MIKIALIEVGAFHDECLHSQIQFLKSENHEITLFCHSDLEPRVKDLPNIDKIIYLNLNSKFNKYKTWYKIRKYIIKEGFTKVIFNSAERKILKLMYLPFPKNIELIGTIHNAHKLITKKYQKKITKKLDKYLTLNDFIAKHIKEEKLTNNKVSSYYPIFFTEYKNTIDKPKNEIWITVPGAIDFNKKDYTIFKDWRIPEHIKIIFLGRSNSTEAIRFKDQAKEYTSSYNFVFFENFISNEMFHDYIKHSDFIMPLIHPNNAYFNLFLKYKISGGYNLAFGYKIPLLMEKSFSNIEDFKENGIFYDYKNIDTIFKSIESNTKEFYKNPKWEFKYQKENYLNFIFDA